MIDQVILTVSAILLLAFGVERLGRATGFPSVIVLILIGLAGKPILATVGVELRGLDRAVNFIGALGLVLIVLEGALDIELRMNRLRATATAIVAAVAGFAVCVGAFAAVAWLALPLPPFEALTLAVPFAVISSAVAIPSSGFLPAKAREFVVYESSISDILGVLLFFSLINSNGSVGGVLMGLIGGGVLSLLLAALCAVGLAMILMRIDGHIRFIPLLAGLFGLYAAGKLMHLSPLIMVLLFGLALNNPYLIIRFRPFNHWLDETYETTLQQFKMLVLELTFAVRGFFFILLGYWTQVSDLASPQAWLAAVLILAVVYGSRAWMLRLARVEFASALTWLAPRGLITILLYVSAKEVLPVPDYLDGTVMLVVLASAAIVVIGRFRSVAVKAIESAGDE
ncbi:MAG: cation:proton antiporter [Gammaproteobacteria bacterium]|nr:cation:proton antiporter [Gammaproteobacteria bacterium]MBU1415610.1 cation:proton antiporter [Gammaproteobacteria bacterium]